MNVITRCCKYIIWNVVNKGTTKTTENVFQLPARAQLLWDWRIENYFRESKARGWRRICFGERTKAAHVGDWNASVVVWQMVIIFFPPTFVLLIAVNFEIHYPCTSKPTSKEQILRSPNFQIKIWLTQGQRHQEVQILYESIGEISQHSWLVFNSACLTFV